ncbi:NitT/TauT family transport system permease protein [Tistlia consotensis]|uniref:NitT/TauT family transport system permease protein n=1 Tax=Tistlia consotensis USBA 355 TaxID=560819 RepID=A0A1Y6BQM1_9PROT|nr:ABC transporter permease [Tistlia consotensis]SMF22140.1 NitT/TauT family transport system permease protein [Tistlia consotensis USBA 355]SNR46240.1 NitT/TauT family transport system permease protein [Tistlia consotensis]
MALRDLLAPKSEIPAPVFLGLSLFAIATLFGGWCLLTYGHLVRPDFLAPPDAVALAGWKRLGNLSLLENIWASLSVIMTGFLLASVLAVPLGVLMGSFQAARALLEPITGFMRYLPVSALIPLLILWIGIGFEEKVTVIFLGTFFQQLILISDVSARVSKDLIDCSYTLGANRRQVVTRVLFPACMPGVMDNLRVTMGWAWTYLVVAELVAANSGLGYMILNAMRGLFTDVILLGVFTIGILGLMTDTLFKLLRRVLLPWSATF